MESAHTVYYRSNLTGLPRNALLDDVPIGCDLRKFDKIWGDEEHQAISSVNICEPINICMYVCTYVCMHT